MQDPLLFFTLQIHIVSDCAAFGLRDRTLFQNSTKTIFYLINLIDFWKYHAHCEFDGSNKFQKVRTGATKDCESCGMLQKHLNIPQVDMFIGNR